MATVIRHTCNRNHNEESDVSETSVPLLSRSPSSICPASPIHQDIIIDNFDRLDDVDGLPVIHCDVQIRVQQIIVENKVIKFKISLNYIL
jgi:myotubularin-related protein 3/4